LAASPFLAYLLLEFHFREALALAVLAGLTDWLDGLLARRFHTSSRLGVILDPIADKALLVTAFLTLGYIRLIPAWMMYLVIGRDVMIIAGALFLRAMRDIPAFLPSPLGKVSTVFQIALVLVVLFEKSIKDGELSWIRMVLYCSAFFTIASGADYVRRGIQMGMRKSIAAR